MFLIKIFWNSFRYVFFFLTNYKIKQGLLKSHVKLMLKIKPRLLKNTTKLASCCIYISSIYFIVSLAVVFVLSHSAPSFASQDKTNCKLHNNAVCPWWISQPGRPCDILN